MLGCNIGTLFKVTVAGGSYQESLVTHLQGVPPGYLIPEEEVYRDLMLRKPGQGELTSPRREPDIPIIITGQKASLLKKVSTPSQRSAVSASSTTRVSTGKNILFNKINQCVR